MRTLLMQVIARPWRSGTDKRAKFSSSSLLSLERSAPDCGVDDSQRARAQYVTQEAQNNNGCCVLRHVAHRIFRQCRHLILRRKCLNQSRQHLFRQPAARCVTIVLHDRTNDLSNWHSNTAQPDFNVRRALPIQKSRSVHLLLRKWFTLFCCYSTWFDKESVQSLSI
jgi:hypothetical protein